MRAADRFNSAILMLLGVALLSPLAAAGRGDQLGRINAQGGAGGPQDAFLQQTQAGATKTPKPNKKKEDPASQVMKKKTPKATNTPKPTETLEPTNTPKPTNTVKPTNTPKPMKKKG